jgi:endonuclease/exonuclease/phosphatase family metal-dependent hydrolase
MIQAACILTSLAIVVAIILGLLGRNRPRVLIAMAFSSLLFVIAVWASDQWLASTDWLAALVSALPHEPEFLVPIACLLACLIGRQWRAACISLASVVVAAYLLLGVVWHPFAGPPHANSMRLLSWNVDQWSGGANNVAKMIRRADPDVFCLQEAGDYTYVQGHQPSALAKALPGYTCICNGEMLFGSRLPIVSRSSILIPNYPRTRPIQSVTVIWNSSRVTVVSLHLEPNDCDNYFSWNTGPLANYVRNYGRRRRQQENCVVNLCQKSMSSTIICGDLNSQPQTPYDRMLTSTYTDAFASAGSGTGYTAESYLPIMRIDAILCGRDFVPEYCGVRSSTVSDHLPVEAVLRLR